MAKGRKTGGKDFGPGNNANPAGRPRIPEEIRHIRAMSSNEIVAIIGRYMSMTREEIRRVAEDPETPMSEIMVASIMSRATKDGDAWRWSILMDRLVGRVADQVMIRATIEKEIKGKSESELMDEARALLSAMEAQKK